MMKHEASHFGMTKTEYESFISMNFYLRYLESKLNTGEPKYRESLDRILNIKPEMAKLYDIAVQMFKLVIVRDSSKCGDESSVNTSVDVDECGLNKILGTLAESVEE